MEIKKEINPEEYDIGVIIARLGGDVDNITDRLGKTIDPWIKPLVVLFNHNKVVTTASCEGHENWGEPFPWIDFEYTSFDNFLVLMEEFEHHVHIHCMFLKDYHTKKISVVRVIPEQKNLVEGRQQFKKFEEFLINKL